MQGEEQPSYCSIIDTRAGIRYEDSWHSHVEAMGGLACQLCRGLRKCQAPAYERITKNVFLTMSPCVVVRDQGRYCWSVYCRGAHEIAESLHGMKRIEQLVLLRLQTMSWECLEMCLGIYGISPTLESD
jgi:hypothetical protein